MANIKVYKMISGEEVIGEEIETTENYFVVEQPASIMMQDQGGGKVGVGIAPFMPYANDRKVQINRLAVAAHATPASEMENEYNRIFGSGIVTPPKGIIGA